MKRTSRRSYKWRRWFEFESSAKTATSRKQARRAFCPKERQHPITYSHERSYVRMRCCMYHMIHTYDIQYYTVLYCMILPLNRFVVRIALDTISNQSPALFYPGIPLYTAPLVSWGAGFGTTMGREAERPGGPDPVKALVPEDTTLDKGDRSYALRYNQRGL